MGPLSLDQFGDRMIKIVPKLKVELSRYETGLLGKRGVTATQLLVLECLAHCDCCPMKALVQALQVKFSAVTMIIERLVKTGFVKRKRTATDRRTVLVELSPKGKKILHEVYQQRRKGIIAIFSHLTSKEREEYLTILEKLVERFSKSHE